MTNPFANVLRKLTSLALKSDGGLDAFLADVRGVIHVGANAGQERDLYDRHGLDVIWIEPIPDVFAELERNIVGYPRQRAFQGLFSNRHGDEIELKIANNNGASSSILDFGEHKEIWPEVKYTDTLSLKSQTLAWFLRHHKIDAAAYDALVVDTQGSELLILQGAGEALRNFRYIKTEAADFEAYRGGCTLKDLDAFLRVRGFTEVRRDAFAQNKTGGTYFDVLYVQA